MAPSPASLAATALSSLLGAFFTFAGVAKTTPYGGGLSIEMQDGFRNGTWPKLWGLPALPFLYVVGVTELACGVGLLVSVQRIKILLGYVAGLTAPLLAQWCALVPIAVTVGATTSHVLNGDGLDKVAFCGIITTLFAVNNFCMAAAYVAAVKQGASAKAA